MDVITYYFAKKKKITEITINKLITKFQQQGLNKFKKFYCNDQTRQ